MKQEKWMQRALQLARQELGNTSPNPAVGAVIVSENTLWGEGRHRGCGLPHAEREAIEDALARGHTDFKEATLIVTLEPCSTHGRTGACCDEIIKRQFKRVIYGSTDPNPAHKGRAVQLLEQAGIEVKGGVLQKESDALIQGFHKAQREGLPWIIVKSAMSLDGKLTRPEGEGRWLSGPAAREAVHQLRSRVDAVLTGGMTVRTDDPALTVRLPNYHGRQPVPVVLTKGKRSFSPDLQLLKNPRTLFFRDEELESVLRSLVREHGIQTVLVEGGGELIAQLVEGHYVDEWYYILAPLLTGGPAQALAGGGITALEERQNLAEVTFQVLGSDLLMHAYAEKGEKKARKVERG